MTASKMEVADNEKKEQENETHKVPGASPFIA
jgi:hypothetical protein